jgi:hypothetical protein
MTTAPLLPAITHNISKSLNSGKDVCAIFRDVLKAFDDTRDWYLKSGNVV